MSNGVDEAFRDMDDRGRSRFDRCWDEHIKEFPPGSLNLPPLLEQRRIEFKLAEGFFRYACMWSNVMVAPISYDDKIDKLMAGAGLYRPKAFEDAAKRQSYLGVLCSAGCEALDMLASEGVGLGHIVRFMRYTPFRCKVDTLIAGSELVDIEGVDLVATDLRASLDLAQALRSGEVSRALGKNPDGTRSHVYVDRDGEIWVPRAPVRQENF